MIDQQLHCWTVGRLERYCRTKNGQALREDLGRLSVLHGNCGTLSERSCKSLSERASEQVERILAGDVKKPLPENVVQSLKNILQKAVQ